jgi:hypothetical protein
MLRENCKRETPSSSKKPMPAVGADALVVVMKSL